MATEEQQQTHRDPEKRLDEAREAREADRPDRTEKPPVEDKHKDEAKEMAKSYEDDRPTVTMPDTGGTVSGTAVSDWIDEDSGKTGEKDKGEKDKKE